MRATRPSWGNVSCECDAITGNQHAIFIGKRLATLGSVKTATYCIIVSALNHVNVHRTDFGCLHVLQVHTDLASDAISKTKIRRGNLHRKFVKNGIQAKRKLKYLEGILLVYLFGWCRESSELVEDRMGIVRRVRSVTRAVGMLGGVDEPENGSARRGHG